MNAGLIVDIVFAVILIFFMYRGIKKGFSGEVIGLVGLAVSSFCAWNFLDPAVELFYRYTGNPALDRTVVSLICAVIIFFTVELIFALIGAILSFLVKVTQLTFTDKFCGMLTGILKTFCIILFVYGVIITFSGIIPSEWMEDSYTMKGASYVWPFVRDFLEAQGILDFSKLTGSV